MMALNRNPVPMNAALFVLSLHGKGRSKLNIFHSRYYRVEGRINALKNILDCNYSQAYTVFKKYRQLSNASVENMVKTGALLDKLGVDKAEIYNYPELLTVPPVTVENRAMLLQEGGFQKIEAHILLNFIPLVRKRAALFKAYGYIPYETDIAQSFLSHTESPPPDIEPYVCTAPIEKAAFADLHNSVLRYYLSWRLQIDQDRITKMMNTYKRFKYKSLRLMVRTLKILEDDLGFSREKILSNAYLIHSHPDNTLNTLRSIPTIGGIDTRIMLNNFPKIIMTNTETIEKILGYLKEHGISDVAIQRCPHVFTLSSETVRWRLEQLQEVPEFQALVKHPRVLRLVHYQNKAQSRLDHLHEAQVRCASLHVLCTSRKHFQKYVTEGSDRTKGMDIMYYLSSVLKIDETIIRHSMQLHPFYCHVPLVSIKSTLDLLLERGYTEQQILENVQLLLYPRSDVEDELNRLPCREELLPEHLCVDSEDFCILKDHHLGLCLYFLERRHHFTGNGVWPTNAHKHKALSAGSVEETDLA
ncbi:transcription termination factor 5, mitochondrial [Schistocerca cancellata]|uniref:transcription termination factor 5, mitochondrial n=1 Tax=Schistocerca cancellata TaxID=274614 RepID=UPI002118FDB3|nr:transcription termination factor 5, mitochondrial [Schistocerca cancellata]